MKLLPEGERQYGLDSRTPQRMVGLATILGAGYLLFSILWPLRWSLVAIWAIVEGIYYVFYYKPRYAELDKQPKVHRPAGLDAKKGMEHFNRFIRNVKEVPKGVDYEAYYMGWFRNCPMELIKRGNAEEFMAYGFFYRTMEEMNADPTLKHLPKLMVKMLEAAAPGLRFAEGHTPNLPFMGHLWEPLKAQWRPLAFYCSTEMVGYFARLLLRRWGFQQGTMDGLAFFTLNLNNPNGMPNTAAAKSKSAKRGKAAAAAAPNSVKAKVAAAVAEAAANAASTASMVSPFMAMGLSNKKPAPGAVAAADNSSSNGAAGVKRSNSMQKQKSSPFEMAAAATAAAAPQWMATLASDLQNPSAVHANMELEVDAALEFYQMSMGNRSFGAGFALKGPGAAGGSGDSDGVAASAADAGAASSPLMPRPSVRLNPLQGALSEQLGSRDTPVLFLHGVGGLPAYLEMILHVMGLGHPVIVVEFKGVSMRWGKVYDANEVVSTVVNILDHLQVKEVCLVGHSYGTFIAGAIAKRHRTRVHNVCLIDPVCFGMFMPHLLYNFLYRKPTLTRDILQYAKDSVRGVASADMHVCATFSRGFYWSDLNLWPEDLPKGSVVMLSGKDDLMDSVEVKEMLDIAGHVKVMYNHDFTHGQFLLDSGVKAAIVSEVRTMLARSGSAVVHAAKPLLEKTMTLARNVLGGDIFHVRMHQGIDGRGYVEDRTNRLVRTFTGNLATMLSMSHSQSFDTPVAVSHPHKKPAGIPKPLSKDPGAISNARMGHHAHSHSGGGGSSSSTQRPAVFGSKLMHTFSGPIQRRMVRNFAAAATVKVEEKGGQLAATPTPVVANVGGAKPRKSGRLSGSGGGRNSKRMPSLGEEGPEGAATTTVAAAAVAAEVL